jgi:hypothetical protein
VHQDELTMADLLDRGWPAEYRQLLETGRAGFASTAGGPARDSSTGAVSGRVPIQPRGQPLPPEAKPQYTALDRWTMLELWARAVPPQYARLLRSPILPDHPGKSMQGPLT